MRQKLLEIHNQMQFAIKCTNCWAPCQDANPLLLYKKRHFKSVEIVFLEWNHVGIQWLFMKKPGCFHCAGYMVKGWTIFMMYTTSGTVIVRFPEQISRALTCTDSIDSASLDNSSQRRRRPDSPGQLTLKAIAHLWNSESTIRLLCFEM